MRSIAISTIILISIVFVPMQKSIAQESTGLQKLIEPVEVTDWMVAGPFLGGSREQLVNPIAHSYNFDTGEMNLEDEYMSVLADGGWVRWEAKSEDEDGSLKFEYENVDWDKITDEWGFVGIFFRAAAYTEFETPYDCTAMINAHGIGSFYINGRQYSGDSYGHNLFKTPVVLDEGINRVYFMTGGYGDDTVKFEVLPAAETDIIVLENDVLLPDLVIGEETESYAGIPIQNTTNDWIERVYIQIGSPEGIYANNVAAIEENIPPLCVVKVPVEMRLRGVSDVDPEGEFSVPLVIEWEGGRYATEVTPRVRTEEDSRIVCFMSGIDNSAQKFAVRYPTNYDPDREYGLILTLHGAGVECEGQVNAYEPKDWAFIVAPTNRRRFGFDWQDWGRLDAMEILDLALERYPIDENRVILTGHSMGGHGTWHIGTTHADRFAAIVPSAGWASFQTYVPWFLRRDELNFPPELERIFDAMAAPDRAEKMLPNLRNTPVLAVHGGDDDNVPPTHGRYLTSQLEALGYDVQYWEEAGMGHWWDKYPGIPGADCVDGLRIRQFMKEQVRDPYPRHVTYVSYDTQNNDSMYWIKNIHCEDPLKRVYIDAVWEQDGSIKIYAENVKVFKFEIGSDCPYPSPGTIYINNENIHYDNDTNYFVFSHFMWESISIDEMLAGGIENESGVLIKNVYYKPFILVPGTSGTAAQNDLNLEIARDITYRWWYRGNGYAKIVPDTELFEQQASFNEYNLIIIGEYRSNFIFQDVSQNSPFLPLPSEETWYVDSGNLALNFECESPYNTNALAHVIFGTSIDGLRLSGSLTPLYSGSCLPTLLAFDEGVWTSGLAGVMLAAVSIKHRLPEMDNTYHHLE